MLAVWSAETFRNRLLGDVGKMMRHVFVCVVNKFEAMKPLVLRECGVGVGVSGNAWEWVRKWE